MKSDKRIKFLIVLAIIIVVGLLVGITFQIISLNKTRFKLNQQHEQIEQLEKQIDYLENKLPIN